MKNCKAPALGSVLFCAAAILILAGMAGMGSAGQEVSGKIAPVLEFPAAAKDLVLSKGLAVGLIGQYARYAVPTDLLAWQIASGTMAMPREGLEIGLNSRNEPQSWVPVEIKKAEDNKEGWIENRLLSGGSLYFVVNSEKARTVILDASSFYIARINGETRGGEKYGTDWVRHPVRLKKGRNEFLFQCERGRFRGRLFEPPADIFFTDKDTTLPDLVLGEKGPFWAGLRLVNATGERLEKIEVFTRAAGIEKRGALEATVAPLMTQKLAVPLSLEAPAAEGPIPVEIRLRARAGSKTVETPPFTVELRAVPPSAHHSRTFLSDIDRSVQYYGVVPMKAGSPAEPGRKPALVLTLHGAGVEGIGQARAYQPKDWTYIVAATNRRPYGFDWEDWGRWDALEVLADASRLFGTDPDRTYLTGHSMGGHGTWQVGVTFPGIWAAIAPSAGWHSFASYGGGVTFKDPSPVEEVLARAMNPSDTTALSRNFLHYGVYILHGDQDDNVPVAQARYMRNLLSQFHPDFAYYERPGAGHWWGNECVDWPPLFDFLKGRTRLPDNEKKRIEFVTADPGISSRSGWVEILTQVKPLAFSKVVIERGESEKGITFKGTTENAGRLAIEATPIAAGMKCIIELDGSKVETTLSPGAGRVYLERGEKGWQASGPPVPIFKNPRRSGGFKDAFRHGFVLVYGTKGDSAEDARAFNKARFDAEMFWVRGNGGAEVLPDTAFDPVKTKDRNIILYGNADTNAAWPLLLVDSPVEVRNGGATVGETRYHGADLAAYFVRPRLGSETASVGVVAWSGPAGWTAASPGQYFISGSSFPDFMLFTAESLRSGTDGVRAIGWFGENWSLERGEVVRNSGRK